MAEAHSLLASLGVKPAQLLSGAYLICWPRRPVKSARIRRTSVVDTADAIRQTAPPAPEARKRGA